ncbi:hypothetical protein [Streptomyces sp. NPDC059271]|uniref:hypothetical protein n=1 Tax=Streptomyces sp. NPDC059271 TaxID=3346799 RepID=UPI0036C35291
MRHLTTSPTHTATADDPQTEVRPRIEGDTLDLTAAVDQAMRKTLPTEYTPELAAQIAADTEARLNQPARPLTAAQRGDEWMNRWGCPGFCVEAHGDPMASEAHSTAPVETPLRVSELDHSGYSSNGEDLPWMTAQVVVVNEKAQAYGRATQIWLGYGVHLAEMTPAQGRAALDELRAFTVRLAAVVDLAEQVAADDFPGDPEVARLDTEATEKRIAGVSKRRR